jgi:hypothetical protein
VNEPQSLLRCIIIVAPSAARERFLACSEADAEEIPLRGSLSVIVGATGTARTNFLGLRVRVARRAALVVAPVAMLSSRWLIFGFR